MLTNRDLSWLSFNKQVLLEALAKETVPLFERINFLAIFSSNLDEFYQVRYPLIQFLADRSQISLDSFSDRKVKYQVDLEIENQQRLLGKIIKSIVSELRQEQIYFIYDQKIPLLIRDDLGEYFLEHILGKLQLLKMTSDFLIPNGCVILIFYARDTGEIYNMVPLPIDSPRFIVVQKNGKKYIVFLEDLIRLELKKYLGYLHDSEAYTFKVNRNAELNLEDIARRDIFKNLKKEINKREVGDATRLLYQKDMPDQLIQRICEVFRLETANMIEGGTYHQLKDFFTFPMSSTPLVNWEQVPWTFPRTGYFIESILSREILIHPPYQKYLPILRFFNEATIHPDVTEIYLTIYRVAKSSRILESLITAARNGKKVTVFVELKARFDEENNLMWAEKMKEAGVQIHYSIPKLKVHAKAALVKLEKNDQQKSICLLGTGNFNESTGKIYTDHFLFSSDELLTKELYQVFSLLVSNTKKPLSRKLQFKELLVGKFNLKQELLNLIQSEIQVAKSGGEAFIFLKMNNLEEPDMINALYQASQSGVKIQLLIRGICCLTPGIKGLSETIQVKRIVDHFLEHGRIFWFGAGGKNLLFLGSADWMNRNLNKRIEICFPVKDPKLKAEIQDIFQIQWNDTLKSQTNPKVSDFPNESYTRSQLEILNYFRSKAKSSLK